MKKAKRFLTGLLSAALALSLCAMPAMAASDGETTTPPPANPVWTETEGSITIHKYEWNGKNGEAGTGEAGDSLPSNDKGETPTPLAGATFTVYQVKNETELKEYYDNYDGKNNVAWPTSWTEYAEKDTATGGYKLKSGVSLHEVGSKTTGADGVVQFGKVPGEDGKTEVLPLGLYLVLETETPDSVKTACEPFFVSVPMTKVSTDTNGALTDWLYDVHVFPKNSTAYGQAVLQKVGKQSGTNPEVTTMQGYKFKLYKKNDDGTWTWIEKKPANGVDNAGEWLDADNKTGVLTTGDDGKISVSGLTKGVYAFVETEVNANDGYILDSGIAYVFKINDNGEMVAATESDIEGAQKPETSVKSFDTTAFSGAQVKVKNYKPDFKKKIKGKKDADYGIGDDVPYTLTVNVPENVAKLKTFTVSDEMNSDQLVVNSDIDVKGKVGEAEETTFREGTEYTLTITNAEGKSGFTIAFATDKIAAYAGGTITITYTAKLQPGASVGEVGNVNSADLKYSKKTDITTEEDPPYDIHDEAVVYTFKTGILKQNEDGEPLKDVEFTLYKKYDAEKDTMNKNGTVKFMGADKTLLTPEEAAAKKLNDTVSDEPKWFAVMDLKTEADGKAVAKGLPTGEYKLVETKTHKGYNLLTGPVDANLTLDYTTAWSDTKTFDASGKLIKHNYDTTEVKNGEAPYNYAEIIIINRKGFNLPTTGGFGTLLFSGIGVLLVVAGVGVLLSLKKKNRA